MSKPESLGPSGHIARIFQHSQLTPLIVLLALVLGVIAVWVTPKEEEPQIDVTMADVMVAFPGASRQQVESLITVPGEQVLSEMSDVEHVYSVAQPGLGIITVQFEVGLARQQALVRLYNKVQSNADWFPAQLGIASPIVKPKGIDDVPIMTLTLRGKDSVNNAQSLTSVAHRLETALKQIPGTRDIRTLGSVPRSINLTIKPSALARYGLSVAALQQALTQSNWVSTEQRVVSDGQSIPLQVGTPLSSIDDLRRVVVAVYDNAPVYLQDVVELSYADVQVNHSVLSSGDQSDAPAVTISIAKKPGENAIDVAESVKRKLETWQNQLIPADVEVQVTRNYGQTAAEKSTKLITDLISATVSVIILVLLTMGWRQSLIVGVVVLVTLLFTLVFSWAWGFTLNRVSLFALIFSIGILVDDGIVITENIHRRLSLSNRPAKSLIPQAVDEVGSPTIMATLTIIAALLPMAFVTGLMGPYMSPIPINASAGMVFSQLMAFIVAPWLALRLLKREPHASPTSEQEDGAPARVMAVFNRVLGAFIGAQYRTRRMLLGLGIVAVLLGSLWLPANQAVILKMLPFDNKSELQIVLDMPESTSVLETQRVLGEMTDYLNRVDEVEGWQRYAGTASPINFNGLVRQYYLRSAPYQGDIQVQLKHKSARERDSHTIARAIRAPLTDIAARNGGRVKVVEVPPGPPVFAPIVAEIYGGTLAAQAALAQKLKQLMSEEPGLVDVDSSVVAATPKWQLNIDRVAAAKAGVTQADAVQAINTLSGGSPFGYLNDPHAKYAVPIWLQLPAEMKASQNDWLSLPILSNNGTSIPLSHFAQFEQHQWQGSVYHKDLRPVTYVQANMAGDMDSPIYGMLALVDKIAAMPDAPQQYFINEPSAEDPVAIKWEGEWQITYETFRDMGIAYSVGIFMIFVLLVAQFRSYLMPLIIMSPIPLTLVGILPGHWLLDKEFTATSMIGMIALAGIIVRNSILIVVFIRQRIARGMALEQAVILAGAVRLKPIALTAVSAMVGAYFILSDPIFNGLAISLIFGLAVSTLLTLLVVPLLYYALFPWLADSRSLAQD
ncbi:multidrug efflux pump subunit AcrB [Idiomarina fontislapidosi]|uniref:Multidrug transporter AcrB n=1 Tax=Idiomarina fontislapidosi TaxID=263723 RepID=A0A432XU50_9GAMM|nr:efflux RND transporter permease subunit [Idiomarina fontislapidosi]PYE31577.1 multidrug efflux pump subunit AcrB [Idiomarina fontislapidosi]RUO52209.1 multidrug transporter AcrB [Idiomarina fontislapidosi]